MEIWIAMVKTVQCDVRVGSCWTTKEAAKAAAEAHEAEEGISYAWPLQQSLQGPQSLEKGTEQ